MDSGKKISQNTEGQKLLDVKNMSKSKKLIKLSDDEESFQENHSDNSPVRIRSCM